MRKSGRSYKGASIKRRDHNGRLENVIKQKDLVIERQKETSSKAINKVKDDANREAERLKNLATEKNTEAANRRKDDKSTIEDLKKSRKAADTKASEQEAGCQGYRAGKKCRG